MHEHELVQNLRKSYEGLLKTHSSAQHDVLAAREEAHQCRDALRSLQAEHAQQGVKYATAVEELAALRADNARLTATLQAARKAEHEGVERADAATRTAEDLQRNLLKAEDAASLARGEVERLRAQVAAQPKRKTAKGAKRWRGGGKGK